MQYNDFIDIKNPLVETKGGVESNEKSKRKLEQTNLISFFKVFNP